FATNFLVLACLLGSIEAAADWGWRNLCAGACLAIAVFVRVQLAPAAVVLMLWVIWQRGTRRALPVIVAFAATIIVLGVSDCITYRYPFQSLAVDIIANTVGGISSGFSMSPPYYYADLELHYDGGFAILMLIGCLWGGWRMPLLLLEAAAIVLPHSLLPHKEYRFIYPALPFVLTLAGIATADLIELVVRDRPFQIRPVAAVIAVLLWTGASWAQAADGPFHREWFRGSGEIAASRWIAGLRAVCGIAAYEVHASALAGFVRYHHDVPVLYISNPGHLQSAWRSFNVVIAMDDNLPASVPFRLDKCWQNGFNEASTNRRMPAVCVLRRGGTCQPGAESDIGTGSPWELLRQPWRDIIERLKTH
ncbi:MAG TPA: hypothetical protein VFW75_14015, partial [Acetobacteraceae bacterium]|nr:hypothetical protein [Acetobacteraceae bacterium]